MLLEKALLLEAVLMMVRKKTIRIPIMSNKKSTESGSFKNIDKQIRLMDPFRLSNKIQSSNQL